MATKIKHKRSSVAGKQPLVSQLDSGELAINTADGKVYLLRDDNTVQDITKRVFENDTSVQVDDIGDPDQAQVTVTVNNEEKMIVNQNGFTINDNIDVENAKTLTFRELTAAGEDGVSIKAPDVLDNGYQITLPPNSGTIGQLLKTDGAGNLEFTDSDIFGGNVIYVSAEQGDDTNDGQSAPVRTVKRACQIASGLVYNPDGTTNGTRINVKVAVGDYPEDNPVIVPDNVVIKGDGLRGCIIRPKNANLDILRVRNACYFGEFTFRDGVDSNFVPLITFDYAVAFDDPDATDISDRDQYINLPNTKPTITTSPYIQNCSIISFLGGNGAKIDGSKVESPNVPRFGIEAENPVIGAIPEQGKSMVANAFTILSFGGTAWRLTNDAYAQIVSCFEIFLLNGVYCQSGGYCSITNSATNFGLYALRASGYSPKAFNFDRSFITSTGESEGKQTLSIVGVNREAPVEEFVIRFREPDYKIAHDLLLLNQDAIAADTVTWINDQITNASASIWSGFTYNEDKCARDVRKILDAIRFDVIFDSNYRTVSAGLRYYNGNGTYFLNNQVDQTVEAFQQAKTYTANYLSDATAISRANALWDEIIDIVQNGEAAADAYVFPTPTGGVDNSSDSGFLNARNQIINNKNFIVDEITSWINDQITQQNDPFTAGFVYNEAKCARDVGLIVDALIYDLTYGGNLQTYEAALAYFIDGVAQYGNGELEETVAAYERLKTVVEQVIVETDVVTSSGTTEVQDKTANLGSIAAQEFAGNRIQEIVDYLNNPSVEPTRFEPDISWVTGSEIDAYNKLDTEGQVNIAQNVTQWINQQIQANIWGNFVYDEAKCERDTKLIVEAVAKDTWDTGNRFSRSAGLSYYTRNLQDSSQISISGQELQTIAAIEQAAVYANSYISDLSVETQDFVNSRFNIVTTIINDPNDLPDPTEVSSAGDITNDFKPTPVETLFNAETDVNTVNNVITIVDHGFSNGQKLIYDPNGNAQIKGLDAEQTYYVKLINQDEFSLTFDESGDFDVNLIETSVGTHKFLSNIIEFYVEEILNSHQTYQTLILEAGSENYNFVPGRSITGNTSGNNNSAIVYSWEPAARRLVVSVEEVVVGSSTLRIQFDETSTITSDHSSPANTSISVNEVATRTDLGSATFSITATDGSSSLTNLINLLEKQCWFHRPSIVNSSAHTWEYAGSGTDYNALPQNGGNTKEEFEQFNELPGRVYSSGTNELGDFKVGDFITAFNRTGNITFRNKVQVDELDALRLSLSDVAIEEISTSVNLGDDEVGGPQNSRLPTQLAVRSFISNRLGGFVDKSVSTAAVPGAIVQLNVNGQLNPDLIPATRQFTNTNTQGYLSRLEQVDDIPPVDLKAGDIATEEYEQVELTLSGNITAEDGSVISQPGVVGAIGYAKGDYFNSSNILVATIGSAWDDTDDSTGDPWEISSGNIFVDGVDSGVNINSKGVSSEIIDNFFLRSSNTSQFLVLDPDDNYTFTNSTVTNVERSGNIAIVTTSGAHNLNVNNNVQLLVGSDQEYNTNGLVLSVPSATTFTIANEGPDEGLKSVTDSTVRTIVTSADGNAQGAVTETRYGVLTNVNNAELTGGTGYTPTDGTQVYRDVALTSTTGIGSGATANITVTAGQITDVDVNFGGLDYAVGDLLSVNAGSVGGTGSGFEVEVVAIENRAYVNILGGELFVASTSSVDFVEDNSAVLNSREINLDDIISHNFLAGTIAGGGAVDYSQNRITINNHGFGNGDPVTYDTLGNVAIGGMINENVYYVKVITNSIIEIYEDFSLLNQVEFLSTPLNNNHNITRSVVNLTDNSIIVENHGYNTGDAIRIETLADGSTSNELFSVEGNPVTSGDRFFVGSITDNSFTLHELRSDALNSINGLVTNTKDITATGIGSAEIIKNNVQVSSVINTSSRIKENWNTLAVTNIDAENIISGTISPSRLASSGIANSDTFLRGDSSYQVVVQKLKKANTVDNPIVLTGSSISGEFYGDPVSIGIVNTDFDPLGTFSTLGVSKFLQTQFDVNSNGSGEVFIKDGVIDAGTLDGLDSAYFLNPSNLSSPVPVNKGGTNISTYAVGDIIYAQTTGTLNTLNIGRNNSYLKSNGTTPEWGTALDLVEGLDVGSASLTSSSTGSGFIYNENVTSLKIGSEATNIRIGSNDATRSLTPFIQSYEATTSQNVVVNFGSVLANVNQPVPNGETEVSMQDVTGILAGMLVTGSSSLQPNTTVSGVTQDGFVYLSNPTTGTLLNATELTFTYTPNTLGVNAGDTINIAGSAVSNLDGSWPVIGANDIATSFTIRTDANVTANPNNVPAGTITIDSSLLIRNRNVILGDAEASSTPIGTVIKGASGIGTDVSGGSITIEPGIGTGNATGGDFIVRTGEVSTTSDFEQTSTERLRIDTSGQATFTGEIAADGGSISSTSLSFNLINEPTSIFAFQSATSIELGNPSGTTTILSNTNVEGDLDIGGVATGNITTNAVTFSLLNTNATTINAFGAATTINMGTGGDGGGTTTIGHDLVVAGDLTVNGNTTTINSTTLTVDDLNIVVASGAANAAAANGAGITVDGANATFTYDSITASWDSSENFTLASGKEYFINGSSVLSSNTLGTNVVNSSLQTLGTINTGTWEGNVISPAYGGTGVDNGSSTFNFGGANILIDTTGAGQDLTLQITGDTNITLPTSGTLAVSTSGLGQFASTTSLDLAGVISDETGSGSLVFANNPSFTNGINAASTSMNLFDSTATTINFGGAATTISIGAATGTTTINNDLEISGNLSIGGLSDLTVTGGTFTLANTSATTVEAFGEATTINMGAATGTFTIANSELTLDGNLNVNGNTIDTDETGTFNLLKDNVTTLAFAQAATEILVGETKAAADLAGALGEMVVRLDLRTNNDLYIDGDLFVSDINNIPIGNLTPASGAFTTLNADNLVRFTDVTNASILQTFANDSASLKVSGGIRVAKDVVADNFLGDMDASYLTSGTLDDARVTSSNITQHQLDITGTGALNAGSITAGFGNINIGSSIFSGNGSGITDLNASNLSSGNVPDARISSSSVTQHQEDITAVGQLTGGSIASGFGNINIGSNTFTGIGSGLTALNASELSSGTVDGARLGGNQSMSGIKTFTDTTAATSTTTGALRISGGVGVAGDIYAGSLNTANGSGIDQLNASNLDSGVVPNARIDGIYSNIVGTGQLDQGSISTGFGNINIGTSTFTGNGSGLTDVDAATLDGIDSTQFIRSDTADTMSALLTISHAGDEILRLQDPSTTGSPYMSFYQGGTRRSYVQFHDSTASLRLNNDQTGERLDIRAGANGLVYTVDGVEYSVYHEGYITGIDADTLDGFDSVYYTNASNLASGTVPSARLTGTYAIDISGSANTLDGINSTQFLRSDTSDTINGNLTVNSGGQTQLTVDGLGGSGDYLNFHIGESGSGAAAVHIQYRGDGLGWIGMGDTVNGTNLMTNWVMRMQYQSQDATFANNITAGGEVTAFSDISLKDNIEVVADPLTKILGIRGVTFTRNDYDNQERRHMGVVAQEVEKYLPEVVHTNDDGIKAVNYGAMAGLFIEAIKEQQTQIETQAAEIAELKEMVKKLLDK